MELFFISIAAFFIAGLTLFSGFGLGLGTILMPVAVAIPPWRIC